MGRKNTSRFSLRSKRKAVFLSWRLLEEQKRLILDGIFLSFVAGQKDKNENKKFNRKISAYLKANDDIDFAHSIFTSFLIQSELPVEHVAHDETNEDEDVLEQHHFEV